MKMSMSKMKVLHVLPTLCAGGAEGFVTNLGVSLASLGAEVRFFLMAGVSGERGQVLFSRLREAGIKVVGAEEHNVHSPVNLLRLTGINRSWRPDIVQANLYSAEVLVTAARVFSIGGGTCYVRRLAGTEICGYRSHWVMKVMDRFFRLTIACSPAVADAYRDFMGANYKSELVTIPNGGLLQEAATKTEEKRQARKALGIPRQAFVVAHIGRMLGGAIGTGLESEPKAQDVLLTTFAQAFGGDLDCVLVLVGDGPLRPEAETLAKNLGIAAQTRFLGQQPEPWTALQAADVFCFPSRREGLPNVLPEAASCGLQVVASDIPEINQIDLGKNWAYADVNDIDGFSKVLQEVRKNIRTHVDRARNVASLFFDKFNMNACALHYLDAYKRVIDSQNVGGNLEA